MNFTQNPNSISSNLDFAVISSMWFFKVYILDKNDNLTINDVTRKVSGSFNTVEQREILLNQINNLIDC